MSNSKIIQGDCLDVLRILDDESVNCCVTSPPYFGLRDYGEDGQMGLEATPDEYVRSLIMVFDQVHRVLKKDGTLWLNLGDSYYNYRPGKGQAMSKQTVSSTGQDLPQKCGRRGNKLKGLKEKDLIGIPWRVALELQAYGWYLRQDIIWHKPNPMPESVRDRCTKAHEYIFLLTKSAKYYYDADAIRENAVGGKDLGLLRGKNTGIDDKVACHAQSIKDRQSRGVDSRIAGDGYRNKRSVWTITTKPYKEAHFATFPPELPTLCIKAGCPEGGTVLDPFSGAGTTGMIAERFNRDYIGIELNADYVEISQKRIREEKDKMGIFDGIIE